MYLSGALELLRLDRKMFIERRVYVMESHFAGRQRYVDISFQNNVMTQAIFSCLCVIAARDNSKEAATSELIVSKRELWLNC